MDPVDLDWQLTQIWPGDPTLSGYVPPVGEHVMCVRPRDGLTRVGVVDDNRCGLFLTLCSGKRAVLTASLWAVHPVARSGCCGAPPA